MSDAAPPASAAAPAAPAAGGNAAPGSAAPAGGGGSPAGAAAAPAGGTGSAAPAAPAALGAGLTPPAAPAAGTPPAADPAAAKPGDPPAAKAEPYTLTAPKDSPFTPEQLAEAAKDAQAHGLSKDVAQKWIDTQAAKIAQMRTDFAAAEKAKLEKWRTELAADPEFQGEQFAARLKQADAALAKVAGPDADHVRNALAEAGIINHPAIVRTFARLAKLTGNDAIEGGAPSTQDNRPMHERWYGAPAA